MNIFVDENKIRLLLETETTTVKMTALFSAAVILRECQDYPLNEDERPVQGASAELAKWVSWAPHGYFYLNSLQLHVEFIYEFVKRQKDMLIFWDRGEQELLYEALKAYQMVKSEIIRRAKLIHGPNWGDATGFNKMDWTDVIPLADMVSKPKEVENA